MRWGRVVGEEEGQDLKDEETVALCGLVVVLNHSLEPPSSPSPLSISVHHLTSVGGVGWGGVDEVLWWSWCQFYSVQSCVHAEMVMVVEQGVCVWRLLWLWWWLVGEREREAVGFTVQSHIEMVLVG